MEILHRDTLIRGGFAGLREHRLLTDIRLFGDNKTESWHHGIGNFVYLSDARFLPNGETKMHSHHEIDVISVMVDGRIKHEGSLEHGQLMESHHVQAQRAGSMGFSHNEINPDSTENRMIQLWVLPETQGQPAGYKLYSPKVGELTRVYGGATNQKNTFDSHTLVDVALVEEGEKLSLNNAFIAYIITGSGNLNGSLVIEGNLLRDKDLSFHAQTDTQMIIIRRE